MNKTTEIFISRLDQARKEKGLTQRELAISVDYLVGTLNVKKRQTNADKIRNMSDEELAELITNMDFDCADYCDSFVSGCAFNCEWLTEPYKKDKEVALKWLQSEAK